MGKKITVLFRCDDCLVSHGDPFSAMWCCAADAPVPASWREAQQRAGQQKLTCPLCGKASHRCRVPDASKPLIHGQVVCCEFCGGFIVWGSLDGKPDYSTISDVEFRQLPAETRAALIGLQQLIRRAPGGPGRPTPEGA